MKAKERTSSSSGWDTENGMIWLVSPMVTRMRLSASTCAEDA